MFFRKHFITVFYSLICCIVLIFTSCSEDEKKVENNITNNINNTDNTDNNDNTNNNEETANVYFFNESSFKVNIFMNFNPESYDPTTLLTSIEANSSPKLIEIFPSYDKIRGDTFYPHYLIPLEDKLNTKTIDLFAAAERPLVYISLVIESGKTYNNPPVKIPQPKAGELKLLNSYLIITNFTNRQVQIINGSTPLYSMHDNKPYIDAYKNGYYEIEFPYSLDNISTEQLHVYVSEKVSFPVLTLEKGKKYLFNVRDGYIETPEKYILDILPIGLQ